MAGIINKFRLLDCPDGFKEDLKKILEPIDSSGHRRTGKQFDAVKFSFVNEDRKKYRIEVPIVKFVGEFYQDGAHVKFDGVWNNKYLKPFKYEHENFEKAAFEWFFDMLYEEGHRFEKMEIEAIAKPENYKDNTVLFEVKTLIVNITTNNYTTGALEWWYNKFENIEKFLKITSTNEEAVRLLEGFDIGDGYLEINGRFIIPPEVFSRIIARKIMFEDTSNSSCINKDYIIYILENWVKRLVVLSEITFVANFEECDIAKQLCEYMVNAKYEASSHLHAKDLVACHFYTPHRITAFAIHQKIDKSRSTERNCFNIEMETQRR